MRVMEKIEIKYSKKEVPYNLAIQKMEKRALDISSCKKNDLIWFLNHDHIYTMGTSSTPTDILSETKIPIVKTNRGGKITYHGPGQRIAYFLINLKNHKDIRKFVRVIENSAIKLLGEFNIKASTFPNRIGIWVTENQNIKLDKEEKIGAIGLRIKKWVTYHGLSFNLNPDLTYYKNINPCGLSEYSSTSMKKLGVNLSNKDFDKIYLKYFIQGLSKL